MSTGDDVGSLQKPKRGATQRKQRQAQQAWTPSAHPDWLTNEFYRDQIQPKLATVGNSAIARRLGVTECYAGRIRQGHRPHPRHWQALGQLVWVGSSQPQRNESASP